MKNNFDEDIAELQRKRQVIRDDILTLRRKIDQYEQLLDGLAEEIYYLQDLRYAREATKEPYEKG